MAGDAFEVITHFKPGDGYEYLIWSLRIGMPRSVNPRPYPRFGITIRQQFVRSRKIDRGDIAWGNVADNGLQVGVRFEPRNEHYLIGQKVVPVFFFRNMGNKNLDISFPRLMTHGYYDEIIAVDAAGKAIPIDQDRGPAGPVGWTKLRMIANAVHEIRGMPIVFGDVERGSAETAIAAHAGQSVRVQYRLSNFGDPDAPAMLTGEAVFSIVDKSNR